MISFNEWMDFQEISYAGGLEAVDRPSMRGGSKIQPDSAAQRVYKVRVPQSTLSMIRSFATDSGGLPGGVQGVLDSMEGGELMMSNQEAASFRDLAEKMRMSGGLMARAADDLSSAMEGAVDYALNAKT